MGFAFYSFEAGRTHAQFGYQKPDGTMVWVTAVEPDPEGSSFNWPDRVALGDATNWTRIMVEYPHPSLAESIEAGIRKQVSMGCAVAPPPRCALCEPDDSGFNW